jgi:hypothetical protein
MTRTLFVCIFSDVRFEHLLQCLKLFNSAIQFLIIFNKSKIVMWLEQTKSTLKKCICSNIFTSSVFCFDLGLEQSWNSWSVMQKVWFMLQQAEDWCKQPKEKEIILQITPLTMAQHKLLLHRKNFPEIKLDTFTFPSILKCQFHLEYSGKTSKSEKLKMKCESFTRQHRVCSVQFNLRWQSSSLRMLNVKK